MKGCCVPLTSIPKDYFTAAAAMFTVATLLYMAYAAQQDKISKSSEFYLTQIKEYFKQALTLIDYKDNSNIKWHQGIDLLVIVHELSQNLTESDHQSIYLNDYVNVGYALVDILKKITTLCFFCGIEDHASKSQEACNNCVPITNFVTENIKMMTPDPLIKLCNFIENARFISDSLRPSPGCWENKSYQEVFFAIVKNKLSDTFPSSSNQSTYDKIQKYIDLFEKKRNETQISQ